MCGGACFIFLFLVAMNPIFPIHLDELYMQRCLQLAANGRGRTSPNPMVGAVVVCDGKIIGEGWHQKAGTPHAEVHAINAVKDRSLLPKSTLYVSLEPCAHFGKTPPCANLIVREKLARVVVACTDPFPDVAGKGIGIVEAAGIPVTVGVCEAEALKLNQFFITTHRLNRPFVALKWAESADGFIAPEPGGNKAISGKIAQLYNHRWRTEFAAIAVGYKTALTDNPQLTPRHYFGNTPLRIVLDPKSGLPKNLRVFCDGLPTWHVVGLGLEGHNSSSVQVLHVDFSKNWVADLVGILHAQHIQSLLVEGGTQTHHAFWHAGVVDEVRRFVSKELVLSGGKPGPSLPHKKQTAPVDLGTDWLFCF